MKPEDQHRLNRKIARQVMAILDGLAGERGHRAESPVDTLNRIIRERDEARAILTESRGQLRDEQRAFQAYRDVVDGALT